MTVPVHTVPVLIIHIGCQDYFQKCILINSKKNEVIVIGDESNEEFCNTIPNVTHIPYQQLVSEDLIEFSKSFINYSTNAEWREKICFDRIFFIKRIFELFKFDKVFHLDSDCFLLEPLDSILKAIPQEYDCAYSLEKSSNPNHMVGCIHNAILSEKFCDKFIELCKNIYCNKTRFDWIEPKIKWHQENNNPGGICDMTFYYLLWKKGILKVFNMNEILDIGSEMTTFDHNINSGYGILGRKTYILLNNMKQLDTDGDRFYFSDKNGNRVRALTLHLQGQAKHRVNELFED